MIEILAAGTQVTVQDLGRPGYAALAVPRSGAFDRESLRRANRLVGNPDGHAALEITLGGLTARFDTAATVALTGAACPGPDTGVALSVRAGTVLRLGLPRRGLRTYLAVRGGVDVAAALGSRSTDTLSMLGPPPLRVGDRLPVGMTTAASSPVSGAFVPSPVAASLHVRTGPRDDWFADPDALFTTSWTVLADSDRVGLRLDGTPLQRRIDRELPSEATLPGALQVPPDGRPILFGPDAPVTGGYPVIAVVAAPDLDVAAQLRPGDSVTLVRLP